MDKSERKGLMCTRVRGGVPCARGWEEGSRVHEGERRGPMCTRGLMCTKVRSGLVCTSEKRGLVQGVVSCAQE
jgi:hypothetical protein